MPVIQRLASATELPIRIDPSQTVIIKAEVMGKAISGLVVPVMQMLNRLVS